MKKYLVNSRKEFISIFKDWYFLDVEEFLGVEFPYKDGTYSSNDPDGLKEDQSVDSTSGKFKKRNNATLPKSYPCIALITHENNFDRLGSFKIQMLEFVYLKDFKL